MFPESFSWTHILGHLLVRETPRPLRWTCRAAGTGPSQGHFLGTRGALPAGAAAQGQKRGWERRTNENNGSRHSSGSRPAPHRKRKRLYRRDACVRPSRSSRSRTWLKSRSVLHAACRPGRALQRPRGEGRVSEAPCCGHTGNSPTRSARHSRPAAAAAGHTRDGDRDAQRPSAHAARLRGRRLPPSEGCGTRALCQALSTRKILRLYFGAVQRLLMQSPLLT